MEQSNSLLMRLPDVVQAVQHSAEWIRLAEQRGEFPRRVQCGPRSVAWTRKSIEKYVDSLQPPATH